MRRRGIPIGLLVPGMLVLLVGVLATLQYRWLGQVSKAEREQLRRSLALHAREFADDFDLEISRPYQFLRVSPEEVTSRNFAGFAAAYLRWGESARFPQVIRDAYLAELYDGEYVLRRYDRAARTFGPSTLDGWPDHLEPVRRQIAGTIQKTEFAGSTKAQIIAFAMTPLMAEVPALIVPVSSPAVTTLHATDLAAGPMRSGARIEVRGAFLVLDLDGDFLKRTMIPALASRHFPEQGPGSYRIAVLSASGAPVFERGFPAGAAIDAERADVAAPFFTLRLDLAFEFASNGTSTTYRAKSPLPPSSNESAGLSASRFSIVVQQRTPDPPDTLLRSGFVPGQVRIARPSWRVVLQHASGSLDAAVTKARRRNLALSFGILAVLAIGIGLVVLNARRAEHLAARQMDFVASVTHELRTPLAVIRSAAQNLSAGVVSDPAQARRYGDLVEAEGQRLTDTIEQVLEYAGLAGNRRPRSLRSVDLAGLVSEVVESQRPAIEAAGCALEFTPPSGDAPVPPVFGDESALRRALHNLLTNAIKHGADGRWVGVSVKAGEGRGRPEVCVTVSDRGRGITPAEAGHLFEPFFRGQHATERQIHGNGIGLSLVKRIVDAHGGRVSVDSRPGSGASFTMHLPPDPAGERVEPPRDLRGSG